MSRWITIATVMPNWPLCGMRVAPRQGIGFSLNWRGRKAWCQPWEFDTFEQVVLAVEHRLLIAGLTLLTLASERPRWPFRELGFYVLWAEVVRSKYSQQYA